MAENGSEKRKLKINNMKAWRNRNGGNMAWRKAWRHLEIAWRNGMAGGISG